jgi:hypothetical protein
VRRRTFHPKVVLILFESEARLAVGSGNVTKSGLEQNTEMFFVRRLRYDDVAATALLRDVEEFLRECEALAGPRGTQLELICRSLSNRISSVPSRGVDQPVDIKFVHSFGSPLLGQLGLAIPQAAEVTRVGVLTPFFEPDDPAAGCIEEGLDAVLTDLLALRPSTDAILDVGAPWDNAPLAPSHSDEIPSLHAGLGRLWAWRRREVADEVVSEIIDYLVVKSAMPKRIEVTNAAGEVCRHEREMLEAEIGERCLWPVNTPTVYAPKNILLRLAEQRSVHLWLHPTTGMSSSGRPRRRPLHAKVFLVTATHRGESSTYALIGSANASRSALSRGVAQGGNVEAGVLCRLDGDVTIHDFLPRLVSFTLSGVDLVERESPSATLDLSSWIDEVVHDAAARTLRVAWRSEGPAPLKSWRLLYVDRELTRGEGVPGESTVVETYDLDAASAEVTFESGGSNWQLPIRIIDLAALPNNPHLSSLGLRELFALLGRRVSAERLATLRAQRGAEGLANLLDVVFGEGLGPTDIFKAWWGAADDLRLAVTISAFRHRLVGPIGVRTAWRMLRDVSPETLSQDEVWIYGCELLRELHGITLPANPDSNEKLGLLAEVVTELRSDLTRLAPPSDKHIWMQEVSSFYGVGGSDA